MMVWNLKKVPMFAKEELINLVDGDAAIRDDVIAAIEKHKGQIKKNWPKKLQTFVFIPMITILASGLVVLPAQKCLTMLITV